MGLHLLLIGLALLADARPSPSVATPEYRIVPRYFTADDGLPQSGVNAIVQSADGYLWIGTFGGLARFDGERFEVFRAHTGAARSAAGGPGSDRILALYEDGTGRLWIGTQDAGLSVFERGAFRHLPVCGGGCEVYDILQTRDGRVWFTSDEGLFRLEPGGGRAERLADTRDAHHLETDGEGRLLVGGREGLHLLEGDRLRPVQPPHPRARIEMLEAESGDTLLVATDRELYRYHVRRRRWEALGIEGAIYATRDDDGRWWVSRTARQVVRQDGAGGWQEVPELDGVGVSSLASDDEGNLWIGGSSRGLLRLREPLFGLFGETQLGTGRPGRAVVGDGRGGMWFGLACSGLRHWQEDGRLRTVELADALSTDCVASLLLDRDDTVWVGNNDGRLARVVDGRVEQVAAFKPGSSVGIWQQASGSYLVSAGRSTYRLDVDAAGRARTPRRILMLEGIAINQVVPSHRGGSWFVGDHGALRLVDDAIVERWTPAEGLSSRFARALYEDPETGVLWIGTYGGGLNRIAYGQVRHYDRGNGLFDDTVSCILPDARGRLWLGGNRGVTLLPSPQASGEEIASVGYAASDGLVPAEVNGGVPAACHRDARGRLWFSLVEGFAFVDPASVVNGAQATLRPHIEHVAVAGSARELDGSTLELAPFARNLEIRYTAINLSQPQNTRFRFRLSGFDEDWVEAGSNRSILYPSVPWGRHLFEVQASLQGGAWSLPASLRISHPQPWYQRPWIWTLATALGLLVLVGSTRAGREEPELPRTRRRPPAAPT
ncbi:two-component regulator propeller domain-containing protein [Luteimonas sp. RD2P54]|uniref:Two-component regulator propeller domain-containing protein n=1 Tax=Luteimonas endophytica TaxID=3042023 RepID=A0ABT6J6M0_9GAMM|nr:two-component regulator propeller domain-containing protein [Luteimonas endophytica]MDH5822409.1 two-component regulator propeller domain-containing protein [Luteimonas endophytica]